MSPIDNGSGIRSETIYGSNPDGTHNIVDGDVFNTLYYIDHTVKPEETPEPPMKPPTKAKTRRRKASAKTDDNALNAAAKKDLRKRNITTS